MALPSLPRNTDLGLLLLRVMLCAVGVFHGGQKLFSLFGGEGMKPFTQYLTTLKVPAPEVSAYLAAVTEFGGGILIALGIFPRLASLAFLFNMLVAIFLVHSKSGFAAPAGMEYPLTLAAIAATIVIAGPGRYVLLKAGGSSAPPPQG